MALDFLIVRCLTIAICYTIDTLGSFSNVDLVMYMPQRIAGLHDLVGLDVTFLVSTIVWRMTEHFLIVHCLTIAIS